MLDGGDESGGVLRTEQIEELVPQPSRSRDETGKAMLAARI